MISSYLIWNADPEIAQVFGFSLRWYGLLFASGFLISQQLLYYMFKAEGKPERDVDTLTLYMIVATVIGARLGHVLFYEPSMLWESPLQVFLPFEFDPFRLTGFQGLASHGAAIGILFGLWLYSRKRKPGQNYLQILDRIVILVALTGALIRMGNFFNSEIIGKPTNSSFGVVFFGRVTDALKDDEENGIVDVVSVTKDKDTPEGQLGRMPVNIYLFFKPNVDAQQVNNYMTRVKQYLIHPALADFVDEPVVQPLRYQVAEEKEGVLVSKVSTMAIARHPAQLYESISCFLLFAFLLWYWSRHKENLPTGRIFGIFMVVLWSLRFGYEFMKENQEAFEDSLALNMGQILSIPLVLVGIFILWWSYRRKAD